MNYFTVTLFIVLYAASCTPGRQQTDNEFESPRNAYGGSKSEGLNNGYVTADGGLIALGATSSSDGDLLNYSNGIWLVRFDKGRNILWQKIYNGSGSENSWSMLPAHDKGYVLIGNSESNDGDFMGNHGYGDAWVAKVDTGGNLQWKTMLGSSVYDYLFCGAATSDNGYILAGYSMGSDGDVVSNKGMSDGWIVKLNANGEKLWTRSIGGNYADQFYAIVATSDGGCLAAGTTQSTQGDVVSDNGSEDGWVVKYDGSGNIQWQKTYGTSDGEDFRGMTKKGAEYWLVGMTNHGISPEGESDALLVRINESGEIIAEKTFGGSAREIFYSIISTQDNKMILTGLSASSDLDPAQYKAGNDAWVLVLDENGNQLSQRLIGGTDHDSGNKVVEIAPGKYILLASTESSNGDVIGYHGELDALVFPLKGL